MSIIAVNEQGRVNKNSVNVRKDAGLSYDRVYYAQMGDIVTVTAHKNDSSGTTWLKIRNHTRNTNSVGYIRHDFVDPYNDSGSGDSSGSGDTGSSDTTDNNIAEDNRTAGTGGTLILGRITGDNVRVRTGPSTSATVIGRFFRNNFVMFYSGKTHGDGTWYRIDFDGDAYVSSSYIVAASNEDSQSNGQGYYNPSTAVAYARNHTVDNGASEACSNYNHSFGFINSRDCANFVNQCLCAGGLPMFDGWSYQITGIPDEWDNTSNKWTVTNGSRCALLGRNRIRKIDCESVQLGDIIYTYNDNNSTHEKYEHVVIASSDYNASTQSCNVCGHTENHKDRPKTLNRNTCRCYRVERVFDRFNCDMPVSIPTSGNGGNA